MTSDAKTVKIISFHDNLYEYGHMHTYVHTISQSSHVSEENGHIEVDTEAKEQ